MATAVIGYDSYLSNVFAEIHPQSENEYCPLIVKGVSAELRILFPNVGPPAAAPIRSPTMTAIVSIVENPNVNRTVLILSIVPPPIFLFSETLPQGCVMLAWSRK